MMKTCSLCGTTSDQSPFYEKNKNRCKECHKLKVRENRAAKIDYYRAYDANRFKNDPRVLERNKRYAASEAGKVSATLSRKKWMQQNPNKRAAHILLGNAVRDGKVNKPKNCQVCNQGGRIHGHHHDYTKPLDVIWCCPKCHAELHV